MWIYRPFVVQRPFFFVELFDSFVLFRQLLVKSFDISISVRFVLFSLDNIKNTNLQ